MKQDSLYLSQVIEKIGSPITAVIDEVGIRMPAAAPRDTKEIAERMGILLNKSTQLALDMADSMDLEDKKGEDADTVRLALTSMAGPIISNFYRMHGKMPEDSDIEKIISSLKTIIPFSENFSDIASATKILKSFDGTIVENSKNLMAMTMVNCLCPIIHVVMSFPFGQSEQKLFQEVGIKLINDATELQKELMNENNEEEIKLAELSVLRSLVILYCQCHMTEMTKLMAAIKDNVEPDISKVWEEYEKRKAMLEILAKTMVNTEIEESHGEESKKSGSSGGQQPAPPPPPEKKEDNKPAGNSDNPMSFFASSKD